jgi:hypothetical protein
MNDHRSSVSQERSNEKQEDEQKLLCLFVLFPSKRPFDCLLERLSMKAGKETNAFLLVCSFSLSREQTEVDPLLEGAQTWKFESRRRKKTEKRTPFPHWISNIT